MTYNFREDFNNLVIDNAEGSEFDWPKHVVHIQIETLNPEGGSVVNVLHSTKGSSLLKCLFSEVTLNGAAVSLEDFKSWYREHISFSRAGSTASSTDPFATLSQLSAIQSQLDETEIIARSDTLQPGETIADVGTRFDAAGRRWETLNDDAVVPDPLTVAALLASPDFEEFTIPEPRSELFQQLSRWTAIDLDPLNEIVIGDRVGVRLRDSTTTGFGRLQFSTDNVATEAKQTVRLRLNRQPGEARFGMGLSAFVSNVVINTETGVTTTQSNQGAPRARIIRSGIVDQHSVEFVAEFPVIGNATLWNFNATGTAAASVTGEVVVLGLDLNHKEPTQNTGGLDTLSAKLHSVIYPASGDLCDVSNQGRGLSPVLGEVVIDADGNAIYGDNIRSAVNTSSDAPTLTIYAMIRYDIARDNDTSVAVFVNTNTFLPIASNNANTEVIRLNNASNSTPFSIDGITEFAIRSEVLAAINTGDFVIAKFENIPSGSTLFIGDHPQNAGFHSTVSLKAIITVEGTPDASDDLIINHALRSGIDVSKLSRITKLTEAIADVTAPAMNNGGGGTGPTLYDHEETFTFTEPTVLTFEHSATVDSGTAYYTFGTTPGAEDGAGNLNPVGSRLVPGSNPQKVDTLIQPGTYTLRLGAGGGSSVPTSSLKITQCLTGTIPVNLSQLASDFKQLQDSLISSGVMPAFKNGVPEVSNGVGANTGNISTTFVPTETRDYVFEYSGDVQQGGGGMSVGTTVLGTDLFVAAPASGDADGSRLTLTRQENFTPPIPLTAGVTYHITQWAGGGGIIFNHTVCVQTDVATPTVPMETLNNAIAITSLQIEAPATGTQLPFETFTLLSGGITSNADRTAFTLPQSDIPYIVKGTAGVDLDGNPGTSNWSIELWDVGAGTRLPGSTNATASAFAVTASQSGYQFYQPNMMAIVDASAGPVAVGMVLAESSTGSGGNTLDILDRTLEIEQKPTHISPAIEDVVVEDVTQQLAVLQNQFDIDSTVLTTIPDLQFDVKTGERWVFEVNLLAESLNAAADLRVGTIAPANSTGRITFVNAENATVRGADINDATLALVVATGTDDLIQVKGIVNAGGDGVVHFQLRNNTGTDLQSFRADSWLEAKKIL